MPTFINNELTPTQDAEARIYMASFPFRIVYVATKTGEADIVSAVTTMRIPNRLAREGWHVVIVKNK